MGRRIMIEKKSSMDFSTPVSSRATMDLIIARIAAFACSRENSGAFDETISRPHQPLFRRYRYVVLSNIVKLGCDFSKYYLYLLVFDWLEQICACAVLYRLLSVRNSPYPLKYDDLDGIILTLNARHELETVHHRHPDVGKDHFGLHRRLQNPFPATERVF